MIVLLEIGAKAMVSVEYSFGKVFRMQLLTPSRAVPRNQQADE
jgi:hypothetical protein